MGQHLDNKIADQTDREEIQEDINEEIEKR